MMLDKNTKVEVCSPDEVTDLFDIIAGILQGEYTLPPYLFIIRRDYVLGTSIDLMKENGFALKSQEANETLQKLLLLANTPT